MTMGKKSRMNDSRLDEVATITAYQDGPYLVRGPFRLIDQQGGEIDVERRTIALCRCGRSRMRPFCDGTHRSIGFRAPGRAESIDGDRGLEQACQIVTDAGEAPGR
jgi:CDGSH-type Zn-finger protein